MSAEIATGEKIDTTLLPKLPDTWRWVVPSEVCVTVASGSTPKADQMFSGKGDVPFLKVYNLTQSGDLDFTVKPTYITRATHEGMLARSKAFPGDVLMNIVGPPLGKVSIVPSHIREANINQAIVVFRVSSEILAGYLAFALLTKSVLDRLTSRAKATAGQFNIGVGMCRALLPIPLAPFHEQQRIVAEIEKQFTRLEAGVKALRRVQANLKRYRAAVLKAACEGRLVPTEAELYRSQPATENSQPTYETGAELLARILAERLKKWRGRGEYKEPAAPDTANLPALPEGWVWTTLDALGEIKGGITKDQNRTHIAPVRSVPYLRVANVQRGYLDLTEVKEIVTTEDEIQELALKPGDILFNEGGDRDKLGRGWVWNGELPECIHQNHVFRARLHVAELNPKLVSWYTNTFGQKYFFDEGKHTTNLASISMTKLRGLPVPIPPPAEQTRIVAEVERRLSVIEELESVVTANLQRATRLRQSILQRAFTGYRNVPCNL